VFVKRFEDEKHNIKAKFLIIEGNLHIVQTGTVNTAGSRCLSCTNEFT